MHFTAQQKFHNRFRFADNVHDSIGQVSMKLDTALGVKQVVVTLDVVVLIFQHFWEWISWNANHILPTR